MLDYEAVRRYCLSQVAAVEEFPFGPDARVFKVMGKMFALMPVGGKETWISLKCDPFMGEVLRENYSTIKPGYHLNKRHWISVHMDGSIPDEEIRDMADASYDLVVKGLPRRDREALEQMKKGKSD